MHKVQLPLQAIRLHA